MQNYELSRYKPIKDAEKYSASLISTFRIALIYSIIVYSYSRIRSRFFIKISSIDAFLDDNVIILNLNRCSDDQITVCCEAVFLRGRNNDQFAILKIPYGIGLQRRLFLLSNHKACSLIIRITNVIRHSQHP